MPAVTYPPPTPPPVDASISSVSNVAAMSPAPSATPLPVVDENRCSLSTVPLVAADVLAPKQPIPPDISDVTATALASSLATDTTPDVIPRLPEPPNIRVDPSATPPTPARTSVTDSAVPITVLKPPNISVVAGSAQKFERVCATLSHRTEMHRKEGEGLTPARGRAVFSRRGTAAQLDLIITTSGVFLSTILFPFPFSPPTIHCGHFITNLRPGAQVLPPSLRQLRGHVEGGNSVCPRAIRILSQILNAGS
ncbi:hypothetical protein B0H13DRAFT_2313312 [Mycena leptocephala]|nr:hypothetical protein B0H13DRAFT_2313312 [Mycena leptocephala]